MEKNGPVTCEPFYAPVLVASRKETPRISFAGDNLSKFRTVSAANSVQWRVGEDRTAALGNSLHFDFRQKLGVGSLAMDCWFEGIRLASTRQPSPAILPDYPSVLAVP